MARFTTKIVPHCSWSRLYLHHFLTNNGNGSILLRLSSCFYIERWFQYRRGDDGKLAHVFLRGFLFRFFDNHYLTLSLSDKCVCLCWTVFVQSPKETTSSLLLSCLGRSVTHCQWWYEVCAMLKKEWSIGASPQAMPSTDRYNTSDFQRNSKRRETRKPVVCSTMALVTVEYRRK